MLHLKSAGRNGVGVRQGVGWLLGSCNSALPEQKQSQLCFHAVPHTTLQVICNFLVGLDAASVSESSAHPPYW